MVLCFANPTEGNNCSGDIHNCNITETNSTRTPSLEVLPDGGLGVMFIIPKSKADISNNTKKEIKAFLQEELGQNYTDIEVHVYIDSNDQFAKIEIRGIPKELDIFTTQEYIESLLMGRYPQIFNSKPRNAVFEGNNCTGQIQNCENVTENSHPSSENFIELHKGQAISFPVSINIFNLTNSTKAHIQAFLHKNITQLYPGVQVDVQFNVRFQIMSVTVSDGSGIYDLSDVSEYTKSVLIWKFSYLFNNETPEDTQFDESKNCTGNCACLIDASRQNMVDGQNCSSHPNCSAGEQNCHTNVSTERQSIEEPQPEQISEIYLVIEMSQYNISDSVRKELELFLGHSLSKMHFKEFNISVIGNMNYRLEIRVSYKSTNLTIPGFNQQLPPALLRRYPKLFYIEKHTGKQGLRHRKVDHSDSINGTQEITKLDCTLKSYNLSEYTIGQNGTIVVIVSNETYQAGQFYIINGTAFVCIQLGRDTVSFDIAAMTTSCIASVCLLLSLVCLVRVKNQKDAVDFRLHACLVVALIIQMIALFLDSLIGQYKVACYVIAVIIHWTVLVTFGIVSINSVDILRIFRANSYFYKPGSRKYAFIGYSLIGICLPAAIITVSVILDFTHDTDVWIPDYGATYTLCWSRNTTGMLVFYVLPVLVAVVIAVEVLLASLIHVRMINTDFNASLIHATKKRFKSQSRILALMALTWLFAFLASGLDVHALWYVFVILNAVFSIYLLADSDFMMDRAGDSSNATKINPTTDSNVSSVSVGDQHCI